MLSTKFLSFELGVGTISISTTTTNQLTSSIIEKMPSKILILDGGLGTSLESKYSITFSRSTPLWSSHLLVSDQPTLQSCQSDFGAVPVDVLLTATYQVSLHGFADTRTEDFPQGIPRETVPRFLDDAVSIAQRAVGDKGCVALSIGPYGACMIPGQEYSGKYDEKHDSLEDLEAWHRERLDVFAEVSDIQKRVGYVALETIPRVDEIIAMRKALAATPALSHLPYWTACLSPEKDLLLPDGNSIETAVKAMLDPEISANVPWGIGINCTKVDKLDQLLHLFEQTVSAMIKEGKISEWPALVLYPDGTNGEVYNTTTQKWEIPDGAEGQRRSSWESQLEEVVKATEERGKWPAVLVGGCCRAGSEDIKKLRDRLVQ
jgi:homocysteine S-methyltransferase